MSTLENPGSLRRVALCLAVIFGGLVSPAGAEVEGEKIQPNEEQKLLINSMRRGVQPADEPVAFLDLDLGVVGRPNPHFGEISEKFLRKHEERMNRKKESVDLVFLGDSITAGWTGAGIRTWNEYFLQYDPVNLGIGGERTQHVLWHIENGFLDEIDPCVVVLMIGTNNLSHHSNQEIAAGITRIVDVIHEKLPKAEVLLLGIFPRGGDPSEKRVREIRERIRKINETISKLDDGEKTRYLDLSANFLDESGQLSREIVPDGLHPNGNGYRVWGQGMASVIDEMMDCDVKTSDRN